MKKHKILDCGCEVLKPGKVILCPKHQAEYQLQLAEAYKNKK